MGLRCGTSWGATLVSRRVCDSAAAAAIKLRTQRWERSAGWSAG